MMFLAATGMHQDLFVMQPKPISTIGQCRTTVCTEQSGTQLLCLPQICYQSPFCCAAEAFSNQAEAESDAVIYDYDPEFIDRKYELLSLKVIHRRRRTGFEETKDFPIRVNDLVAGRYQVKRCLCSACACCQAVHHDAAAC